MIISQTCTASWGNNPTSSATGSGSADNGLSTGVLTTGANGAISTSTLYTGKDIPGASFSVTCTPSATFGGTNGSAYDAFITGQVNVTYSALTYPLTISLSGTTKDSSGNLNILVGQGCTASLVGIPDILLNNTAHPPTYSWNVPGTTFQDWNGDTGNVPVSPDNGPGPLNHPSAHWFWNDKTGPQTVTCTVTLTPPEGQGSAFQVTATQKVSLFSPSWTASNHGGYGYIVDVASIYKLEALPVPGQGYSEGSTWRTAVTTPPLFGTGQFGYAQIVTVGAYLTPYGGQEIGSPNNGQTGVDGQFPYLGATFNADGALHDEGDSPRVPLNTPQSSPDVWQYVRAADTFKTYLMFKPPLAASASNPSDAQWVPLAESDWSFKMGTYRPLTGHWSDFPFAQSVGGVSVDSDFTLQPTHPSWNQVVSSPGG